MLPLARARVPSRLLPRGRRDVVRGRREGRPDPAEPVRAAADAAAGVRPQRLGVDARRDRAPRAAAARADPFRRRRRRRTPSGRAAGAPPRMDAAGRRRRLGGGVRARRRRRPRRRGCAVRAGDAAVAVVRRSQTVLGQAARGGVKLPPTELGGFYRGLGVDYAVTVIPDADPELGQRLERLGFRRGYAWAKFLRDPAL